MGVALCFVFPDEKASNLLKRPVVYIYRIDYSIMNLFEIELNTLLP